MAKLIDSYSNATAEYNGKWYITKPTIIKSNKFKDVFGILLGKYTAVYFYEDIIASQSLTYKKRI